MSANVDYAKVHGVLKKHMLVEGMDVVWDYEKSHGSWFVDGKSGKEYLDFFSFFATNPLGHNHPKIVQGEAAAELARIAPHNPSNSDVYTREMADFVDTFASTAVPKGFKYTFYVAGGALAVENALKAAFDWKVRKNHDKGIKGEKGFKILHFNEAFHGRSGYTLSLTNTLPDKVKHFPKFDWPRVTNPKITFPVAENLGDIVARERRAVTEIEQAFMKYPDEIAAIIIEPIQGEGGDNHFRPEFLQTLRRLADENDALLIFDEVQSGMGLTGTWWAFEQLGVQPDIFSFGKKMQVCGIVAGPRMDEVKDHVFRVGSRINSTWGGNLVDMVRAKHYIRVIEEDNLLDNARVQGEWLLGQLQALAVKYPTVLSNPRGRGLMAAVTVKDTATRDKLVETLFKEQVMILPCGFTSIRVRPSLNVTRDELEFGVNALRKGLEAVS